MHTDINSEEITTDIYTAVAYQRAFLHKEEIPAICDDFEEILNYFPGHRLTLYSLYSMYKDIDIEKSEDKLLQLIYLYPKNYEYLFELLLLYENSNKNRETEIKEIEKKLDSINYSSPIFLEWKADKNLKSGRVKDSIDYLIKYLLLYPNDEKILIKISKLFYLVGEFSLALKYISKINPLQKGTTIYRIEGISNFFLNNFKESLKILESIILINPNDVYALYFLSDIEERRRRSWKSDQYFSRIISRSNYSLDERAIAALSFLVLNEQDRAEQYIQINFQKSADHIFSHFINGIIMLSQKKFHKCYDSLQLVYEKDYFLLRREFKLIKKSLKSKLIDEFVDFLKEHSEVLYNFFTSELDEPLFSESEFKEK